jgi:hypothetical protein
MEHQNENLGLSTGLKVVCALLPIVGLVLYFTNSDQPAKKKGACTFALVGVGIGIVLQIVMVMMAKV